MEGVPGPSEVIEPRDLRFHVKIVFLVTEIFVFCIQAKVTILLLAFAQQHGVILTEILGKGGVGAKLDFPATFTDLAMFENVLRFAFL